MKTPQNRLKMVFVCMFFSTPLRAASDEKFCLSELVNGVFKTHQTKLSFSQFPRLGDFRKFGFVLDLRQLVIKLEEGATGTPLVEIDPNSQTLVIQGIHPFTRTAQEAQWRVAKVTQKKIIVLGNNAKGASFEIHLSPHPKGIDSEINFILKNPKNEKVVSTLNIEGYVSEANIEIRNPTLMSRQDYMSLAPKKKWAEMVGEANEFELQMGMNRQGTIEDTVPSVVPSDKGLFDYGKMKQSQRVPKSQLLPRWSTLMTPTVYVMSFEDLPWMTLSHSIGPTESLEF